MQDLEIMIEDPASNLGMLPLVLLEVLHVPLVLFRLLEIREGTEVAPLSSGCIFLL